MGAEKFDVPGYSDVDALLDEVDAVSIAVLPSVQVGGGAEGGPAGQARAAGEAARPGRGGRRPGGGRGATAGVASVVFFTFRFHASTQTWLTQAARTGWPAARGPG